MQNRNTIGTSLWSNDRGAIMVMGLFMAVALVSVLYYVVGIGHTILFREGMQDGADATAISAAIVHARGMNIIAMINILMAAALAVLVVLKVVSATCFLAITICAGLSWVTFGGAAAAIPPLKIAQNASDTAYDSLKPGVFAFLRGARQVSLGIKRGVPMAAQAEVHHLATTVYSPPVKYVGVLPIFEALPLEDDSFDRLCKEAGEYAGDLIVLPFRKILPGWLASKVSSGIGSTAKAFSSYFCGAEGSSGEPPTMEAEIEEYWPKLDTKAARECREKRSSSSTAGNAGAACDTAAKEGKEIQSSINTMTGDCEGQFAEACEKQRRRARTECKPASGKDLRKWWWQSQTVERRYGLVRAQGRKNEFQQIGPDKIVSSRYIGGEKGSSTPPCGRSGAGIGFGWTQWDVNEGSPVCTKGNTKAPATTSQDQWNNTPYREVTVKFETVSSVASCMAVITETIVLDETLGITAANSSDKVPQRVKKCAELGQETFQLKTVAYAHGGALDRYFPGVALASWGKSQNSGPLQKFASTASRLSVAQAEYFYAGSGSRDEWMFNMSWKARLRRVQFAKGADKCNQADLSNEVLPDILKSADSLLLH